MAVTLTVQQLAYGLRLVADTAQVIEEPQLGVLTRTLAAATALVVGVADLAPDAVQNEATLRLASFLYDTPPGGSQYVQNPLRHSGAMALLASYRTRRVTAIGSEQNGD